MSILTLPIALLLPLLPQSQGPKPGPAPSQSPTKQATKSKQDKKKAPQVPAGSQYALPTAREAEKPYSMPFRCFAPKKDHELSEGWLAIFSDANEMYRLWRESKTRGYDEQGRPTTREGHFKTIRDRLEKALFRQGGMIRIYRMDEANAARRRASIFASMFVTPKQDAVDLLRLLPYESIVSLRQEAIEFSRAFLRKQVREGAFDENGKPGEPKYFVDAAPWIDLTRSRSTKDRVLALEVLTEIASARREGMVQALPYLRKWFPDLLTSKSEALRERAKAFMTTLEPEARFPKDPARSVEYFARVYKKIFPPIRLKGGRCDLYPSKELDALVATAREHLTDRSATKLESRVVRTKLGTFDKYGIRLLRVPEAIQEAGITSDMLLTSINGQPITGPRMLLNTVENALERGQKRFVLEWVSKKGQARARTYARKAKEDL